MILIADGGSTKTSWCLINDKGEKSIFTTEGYNPYFCDTNYIISSLTKNVPNTFSKEDVKEINYYGAGVHNDEKSKVLALAMEVVFPNAEIFVNHDLLAAARALLGDKPGFAAILGTGTNTCIYDGEKITEHIDSLAFILGDEGSGCYIGKKLLADYVRGYLPAGVKEEFWNTFKITEDEVLENIYSRPLPNRFCASFSKFVYDIQSDKEYSKNLVKSSFNDFFKNLVSRYPNYKNYTFNCVGSVAYNFKNILEEVANEYDMKLGVIIKAPIDALVDYHNEKFQLKHQ